MSTIIFKIEPKIKDQLTKRAKKLNISLSEFMRLLIQGKISLQTKPNPLLSLSGILTDKETDEMFSNIKKDRRSKN
jgi:antitoxin component of RelBE/YafQ-DinJ toxin-antitoxin module